MKHKIPYLLFLDLILNKFKNGNENNVQNHSKIVSNLLKIKGNIEKKNNKNFKRS